ncbi:MAG TPA: hypothetical protein VGQ42_12135 [Candidatus Dormibacteraeota bacterium]|jgi:hypothetical protein|nr:hypothetical protein [Candidatus Dormibacteraeota bacterium]
MINPNARITWLDDAGGIVLRPAADSPIVNPRCGPNDVALSAAPEHSAYNSGETVMIRVDARFKGLQACFFKVACFPDVTVWDGSGQHVWHANGEVAGSCGGGTTAVLSQATQHVVMTVYWNQDACWPFCNRDVAQPDPAAPAGKYTVSASWREFGSSPKSSEFQLQ